MGTVAYGQQKQCVDRAKALLQSKLKKSRPPFWGRRPALSYSTQIVFYFCTGEEYLAFRPSRISRVML